MYGRIHDPGMRRCLPGPRHCLEGQLSPRIGSMSPSRPVNQTGGVWGGNFHIMRGGIDPGDDRFRPRGVEVVDLWKVANPGMGNRPRVRRDLGVVPSGNSRGTLVP